MDWHRLFGHWWYDWNFDSDLSLVFNDCLDNPLALREMKGLTTLDFWSFIDFCYHNLIMLIAVSLEKPKSAPADRESSQSLSGN